MGLCSGTTLPAMSFHALPQPWVGNGPTVGFPPLVLFTLLTLSLVREALAALIGDHSIG